MIYVLFVLWMHAPCNIDLHYTTAVEQDGTSYTYGEREIWETTEGFRFYRLDSPYLDKENGRLQQVATSLQFNDPAFMESLLTRPASCDLPISRQRG